MKNRNSFLQYSSQEYINKLRVRFVRERNKSLHTFLASIIQLISQKYLFLTLLVFFDNPKLCEVVRGDKGTVARFQKYIYYVCVFHVRVIFFEVVIEEGEGDVLRVVLLELVLVNVLGEKRWRYFVPHLQNFFSSVVFRRIFYIRHEANVLLKLVLLNFLELVEIRRVLLIEDFDQRLLHFKYRIYKIWHFYVFL